LGLEHLDPYGGGVIVLHLLPGGVGAVVEALAFGGFCF